MSSLTPFQFKLDNETIDTIDRLRRKLGLRTRVDVVRHALSRLALVEAPLPQLAEETRKRRHATNGD